MGKVRITYILLFVLVAANVFSQYNNSWINYSQKYYKIKVADNGLYKLDSATLANAGIPISTINPKNLQIFQKGKELYPYISGEADDTLNTNDYILFYAEKNTGLDDSLLFYLTPAAPFITNPYYSVINDTSAVFLTWNSSVTNHRLTLNTDTSYSSYSPYPYYTRKVFSPWVDYSFGPYNAVNQNDPRYVTGEGFVSAIFLYEQGNTANGGSPYPSNFAFTFNTSAAYTSGPLPYATVCFSGANDIGGISPDHIININYQGNGSPQSLGTYSVDAYNSGRYSYLLNPVNYGSSNTTINVTSLTNPLTGIDNLLNVNYINVTYPQTFNMINQVSENIYLPDDPSPVKFKLSISNFNNQGTQPVLIDNNNHLITFPPAGSAFNVLLPNSGAENFCYLSSWANVNTGNSVVPVNGNGSFTDYLTLGNIDSAFVIISHPKLINAPSTGVTQYANWRRNGFNGGNYNTIVASIEDLYCQFAYGVERTPLSIRNFCAYLIANTNKPPSNLFLIGKGTHAWEGIYYNPPVTAQSAAACLVPSFGNPSSDMLLTAGLPGSSIFPEPAIPTGRLSAQTDQDVLNYLSKAQLYSAQSPDSLWKKRAIHFIGGNTLADQQTFISYMNVLKADYQAPYIGGQVSTFYKISTAPISTNTNDSVALLINQGVSLMTFFGHGSPTGFDQNIDAPGAYNSAPHIPFIIANSCYTGDMFSADQITNSEDWVLAPNDKGSIGYVATTAEGVAYQLSIYTNELYKQFGYTNYGSPYGYCMKNTIKNVMHIPNLDSALESATCMEMTLHGDPAIKANTATAPDYGLSNSDLIFDTKTYPGDSIGLKIVMTNFGKAVYGNYTVRILRSMPNGDTTTVYKIAAAPLYKDTLSFFIPENYVQAVGVNNFSIHINYVPSTLQELNNNYSNNVIGPISLFIRGSDIEPVWPYKYAIVPNLQKVTLKASTADAFAPLTTYRFQMDTSNTFSSPVLTNTTVTAVGGVVSLPNVSLLNADSVVYFWRVAKDTVASPNWKQSSFQVIKNKYGWEQAQFYQFNHDGYQYVQFDSAHRKFTFVNDVKTIKVNTGIASDVSTGGLPETVTQLFYNNAQVRLWSCGEDGWSIAVFDTISGNFIHSDTTGAPGLGGNLFGNSAINTQPAWHGNHGNCICDGYANGVTYDFGQDNFCLDDLGSSSPYNNWQGNLAGFLNSIPNRMPVLAYTVKCAYGSPYCNLPATAISPALLQAFNNLGSTKIDSLQDSTLMIFYGRKGISPVHEVLSTGRNQLLSLSDTIDTHFKSGYIASEIIGPARKSDTAWKSLHWHWMNSPGDVVPGDSIVLQLIGIDSSGVKTVLANFPHDSTDITDLSRYMNQYYPKFFPNIQLVAQMADDVNHTPPQLKRWQVIFDQVPEAALYPSGGYSLISGNTVSEGQNLQLRMPIKNISDFPFKDSLLVTYYVQDANRNNHVLPSKLKRRPFLPDSVLYDTISVNTLGLAGGDIFGIDVNPPGKPKYQSEQFHFNNIAQFAFTVNKDKINPILDVTFDGTHILNGDIISAKPDILVSLKDENKFLALNDTGSFAVYTSLTPGAAPQRIYFNNPLLQFTPAVLPNNSCKINYKPTLSQDGMYTLSVKASDRSGNISGQFNYQTQFEVINKPMITEVLNYPNPFSTSTKFVFTITGTDVPETLKIQIMTITGKIVKEISREELGYLHIGRNITDYAWDGTDQYGGKLGVGVYFYHITTRLHGNQVDHMNTSADEYFKKGIGKMVIIR
jgi:hypothetical protein